MNRTYIRLWHFVVEILSYVLLVASFIVCIRFIVTSTGDVPTHFTLSGEPDGYGPAAVYIIMPVAMFLCNLTLSLLMHFSNPGKWNLPVKPTPANENLIFSDVAELFVIMEFILSLYSLIYMVTINNNRLSLVSTCGMLLAITVAIGVNITKTIRHGKMK